MHTRSDLKAAANTQATCTKHWIRLGLLDEVFIREARPEFCLDHFTLEVLLAAELNSNHFQRVLIIFEHVYYRVYTVNIQ